jgi:sporulation protein YlmC with PRC-barrel domain
MLQHITEFYGNKLNASDGDIGTVEDFYIDDQSWHVRYLVAETGTWLSEWQVLISPNSIERTDLEDGILIVNLTRKQIEDSPPIELHRPVSRQFEIEYYNYYGWPFYWSGDSTLGLGGNPVFNSTTLEEHRMNKEKHRGDDPHLRSTLSLVGHEIEASDGTLGRVTDFLVDDHTWAIKELLVEAGHWYSGKEILIPTAKVKSVSFDESRIHVYLTKEDIELTSEHHIARAHRH